MDIAHFEIHNEKDFSKGTNCDNKCEPCKSNDYAVDLNETHRLIKVCNNHLNDFACRVENINKEIERKRIDCLESLTKEIDKFDKEYKSTKACLDLLLKMLEGCDDQQKNGKVNEIKELINEFKKIGIEIESLKQKVGNKDSAVINCNDFKDLALRTNKLNALSNVCSNKLILQEIKETISLIDNKNAQSTCCKIRCWSFAIILLLCLFVTVILILSLVDIIKGVSISTYVILSILILAELIAIVFYAWHCCRESKKEAEFEKKKKEEILRIISRLTY